MRVPRIPGLALAIGAAMIAGPGSASAQVDLPAIGDPDVDVIRLIDIPLTVEGTLDVEFHAGPDTGCAAPCDLAGSVTWVPGTAASLTVFDYRVDGRRELTAAVLFFGEGSEATTTTRVSRARPGGGHSTCVDARRDDFGVLDFSAGAREMILAQLLGPPNGPGSGANLLGTRCAGPADLDLAPLLPRLPLARDVLMRGGAQVDFSAVRPFAAHGIAGTLRSSVKLGLGPATIERPAADEFAGLPRVFRTRRKRQLIATYAIERTSGTVTTSFTGNREPALCGGLDSCGVTGSVQLTPAPVAGEATLVAIGPRRSTRTQLAAALGLARGPVRRGIDVFGVAYWDEDKGTAVTSTRAPDGYACTDQEPLGGGGVFLDFGRRRVSAVYGDAVSFLQDPFSSRCQGPALIDAAGTAPLARGSVRRIDFRRKRVTLLLQRGSSFVSEGYDGSSRSTVSLVLRRRKVETGPFTDIELVR